MSSSSQGHGEARGKRIRPSLPAPVSLTTLLFSSTTLVDQVMTASLAPGSLAVLGFGSRVTALVIAVAKRAMSWHRSMRWAAQSKQSAI